MHVTITDNGIAAVLEGLKAAPGKTRVTLLAAAEEATKLLQGHVQADGFYPYDTGTTVASIGRVAFSTPTGVLGVVGSPSAVAVFLELGTKRMKARPRFKETWAARSAEVVEIFEQAGVRVAADMLGGSRA